MWTTMAFWICTWGMGTPSFATLLPHVLLRNNDGKTSWISRLRPARANCIRDMASHFADLERNGHEDIVRRNWRRRTCGQAHDAGLQESGQ